MHRHSVRLSRSIAWLLLAPTALWAQTPARTDERRPIPYPVTPPADFLAAVQRGTRTLTGVPGPGYWQQWTTYTLRARLDVERKRLEGSARLIYRNRSPNPLPVVFLHLLQNIHLPGAVRNEPQEVTGGIELTRVVANGIDLPEAGSRAGWAVNGTVLGVRLPRPVATRDSLVLELAWGFDIPQSSTGRMGWSRDDLFYIAYWYPQMAVLDDVAGWQLDQFLGNAEFYVGFGTYDVTIEAPEGWVVTSTGRLQNADAVFPDAVLERLRRAEQSDTVVHVLTERDVGAGTATRRAPGGYLAWRFTADSVRDVAFSATRASMWDAARTAVGDRDGDGRPDYARVDAIYRATAPRWRHVWRYAQHAVDFLSRWTGMPYPWPHMSAVEGEEIVSGGMEYPMMTLISDYNTAGDSALYYVTAHELAHMWVPMIVGTDERRYSWMDEGTTSFNENQARKEFFPRSDADDPDRQSYLQVARADLEGEIMRRSDYQYPGPAYGVASYSKPATLLATLRALLGDETFTRAYQTYLRTWAYKHPRPWDFFDTFNHVSGRNLGWFWRTWYYETWTLDQAVGSVTRRGNENRIVVEDRGLAPMPARLTITLANGDIAFQEVPVETWLGGARSATVTLSTSAPIARVEIDAERSFPDIDRSNNVWVRR